MTSSTDIRRIVILGLRGLVAIAVLAWVVSRAGIADTGRALGSAAAAPLVAAAAASVVFTVVVSARLAMLLRRGGMPLTWSRVWLVNLAAQFYGLFVPGGAVTNTAIRYVKLAGGEVTGRRLVYRMLADRAGGLAGLAFVGALALAISEQSLTIGAVTIACGAAVLLLPRLIPPSWGNESKPEASRLRGALSSAADVPWLFVVSVVAQIPGIVAFVLIADSLDLGVAATTITWVRSAALLAGALPFSISGLGIREGVLLLALTDRGVADPDAVAFGILVFAATIVAPAVIGGVVELKAFVTGGRRRDRSTG